MSVQACVLTVPGTNCHRETAHALEIAGAIPDFVHINQLRDGTKRLSNYAILAASGGFADGDHIAAGRLLGIRMRTELAEDMTQFLADGKFMIGICNGFQALVESGLLPDGLIDGSDRRNAALAPNKQGGFHCGWKKLRVEDSVCKFVDPETVGKVIELQGAHGEGLYVMKEEADYQNLLRNGQVVFRFCDDQGLPTENFPENPNGSPYGVTGVCDPSGQVLGMMPHPERAVSTFHPDHPGNPGLPIFTNMVARAKEL